MLERGEWVVEVERPARPANRNGAKSDELDAIRAAREALGRKHLAQPRRRGDREAIRVLLITRRGAIRARTKAINHLKALVVTSREEIRHQLRRHDTNELITRCARLRTLPSQSIEHRATIMALRCTARRILLLEAEANDLETELERLVKTTMPWLLDEVGVGPITSAAVAAISLPAGWGSACASTRTRSSGWPRRDECLRGAAKGLGPQTSRTTRAIVSWLRCLPASGRPLVFAG